MKDTPILSTRFVIEPMEQADVPDVSRVERRCFENPWPSSAYRRELRNPRQNCYVVLRALPVEIDANRPDLFHALPEQRGVEGWRPKLPLLPFGRRTPATVDEPRIAGFAGMWAVYDEAHITTIGIDPAYRGRGFGELLLATLFDEAIRRGATWVTLEVRVSNEVAQQLYAKWGMSVQNRRLRYYSDNGEDAFVMWSRSLRDPEYLTEINVLRRQLADRLGPSVSVPPPAIDPWVDGPQPPEAP